MKTEAIIFDLDGTLWDATHGILKTWNIALEQNGNIREPVSYEELSACLGLPMDAIAKKLFPDIAKETQKKVMDDCCRLENEYLTEYGGTLFPALEETLSKLQETYELYIVSNCQCGYIEAFLKAHHLESYFKDIECWGNTNQFKGANIRLLMERNHIKSAVIKRNCRRIITRTEIYTERKQNLLAKLHIRGKTFGCRRIFMGMTEGKKEFAAPCVIIKYLHIRTEIFFNQFAIIPRKTCILRITPVNMGKIPAVNVGNLLLSLPLCYQFISIHRKAYLSEM